MKPDFEAWAEDDAERAAGEREDYILELTANPGWLAELLTDYFASEDDSNAPLTVSMVAVQALSGTPKQDDLKELSKLVEMVADWAIDTGEDDAPEPARSAQELREEYEDRRTDDVLWARENAA